MQSLDLNHNPCKDVHPELITECGLARVLAGAEEVPLPCNTLLLDAEVGAVDSHQTIFSSVVDETALKVNL